MLDAILRYLALNPLIQKISTLFSFYIDTYLRPLADAVLPNEKNILGFLSALTLIQTLFYIIFALLPSRK